MSPADSDIAVEAHRESVDTNVVRSSRGRVGRKDWRSSPPEGADLGRPTLLQRRGVAIDRKPSSDAAVFNVEMGSCRVPGQGASRMWAARPRSGFTGKYLRNLGPGGSGQHRSLRPLELQEGNRPLPGDVASIGTRKLLGTSEGICEQQ